MRSARLNFPKPVVLRFVLFRSHPLSPRITSARLTLGTGILLSVRVDDLLRVPVRVDLTELLGQLHHRLSQREIRDVFVFTLPGWVLLPHWGHRPNWMPVRKVLASVCCGLLVLPSGKRRTHTHFQT